MHAAHPIALAAAILVAACGGGADPAPAPPPAGGPTDTQRAQAASSTAQSASNACAAVAPFYWEIGDRGDMRVSGSVAAAGNATSYDASSSLAIASASKWLFAAYVAERRAGALTAEDLNFLNFRSGYDNFIGCTRGQTVDGCLASPAVNGSFSAGNVGRFLYNGGHMQKHASLLGLGGADNAALAGAVRSQIGNDIALSYNQPQLAGGAQSTAGDYARFLRKLLDGSLHLGALLGTQAVCTNPLTCAPAIGTPVPLNESWHYSLGHWVEDDPQVGDGAFSSAGAFGFYPWIDASRTYYGVLAREAASGSGDASMGCGRLIRKAWVSGSAL
jgi:hypothetical protein